MLENYPLDILRTIVSQLDDRVDLKSLSETSRFWNEVTNPFLYRNIFISTSRNDYGIIQAHLRAGVLQYTRNIQVLCSRSLTGPNDFDFEDYSPCTDSPNHYCTRFDSNESVIDSLYNWDLYQGLSSAELADKKRWIDPDGDPNFYPELFNLGSRRRILSVLIRCREGFLKSFRQPFIEQLRFGFLECCNLQHPQLFTRLKRLAILNAEESTFIDHESEVKNVRDCVTLNCGQLEYLEISCIYWQLLGDEYDIEDQHFTEALIKPCRNDQLRFPNIQHLVLEGYLFNKGRVSLLKDLNPEVLHTLSLRSCLFWEDLLPLLNSEDRPFHIRTLEVQAYSGSLPGVMDRQPEGCRELASFIEKCEALENLFIGIERAFGLERLWRSLLRHRKTLKSFVFYSLPGRIEGPHAAPTPYYVPNLSFDPPYHNEIESGRLTLKHLDLELLGVSYEPEYLVCFDSDSMLWENTNKSMLLDTSSLSANYHGQPESVAYSRLPYTS
ncbi:hypothetical protein TRV_07492 [Trichophyton verrucosum HKI 0517]|uniref:F-box domain-containing protein n=1 Tax=Trichophyton verrucosum (strain HKI 0517) TaxID=663202 RepID=D4DJY4_TRIVH|nr:uncharacterized protein TRV_07492 [Trichophyton verrucosum HKI 0517]EFE37834.1 hypothetical protein TRV_07492 [Trichophyton verrucosum HKI 0517]